MAKRLVVICVAVCLSSIAAINLGQSPSGVANAAQKGDRAAVLALIAQKADVNAPQVDGATALHWAVYRNDPEMVDGLLRAGARVSVTNRNGISPLFMASLYGNPAIINQLLKAGADAKQKGPNGETMLMLAARNGNPEAIKALASAGADVNAKENLRGTTALMWAVEQRHPAATKALLEAGADFSARSGNAGNPRNYMAPSFANSNAGERTAKMRLCIAANGGPSVEEQIAKGGVTLADVDGPCAQYARGVRGRGAPGANNDNNQAAAAGNAGGQRRGGQGRGGGAPPPVPEAQDAQDSQDDAQDDDQDDGPVAGLVGSGGGGLTPLILAARENDIESAKLLVAAGADVNQISNAGWTPLLMATNNRNYQLGKFLVENGADVNKANVNAFTPLYLATDNRNIEGGDYPVPKPDMDHLEFIKILLEHGADPNTRVNGNTETRTIFTMQWFFEAGATPFVRAAQSSDTELMRLLLAYGADPKIATNHGDTALSATAGIGWVEGVTYEWSKEANVEAVRILLDLGLDPNSANREGRTPLMGAALKGRSEVIRLLVERGADLNQRDKGSRDTVNANSAMAGHTWRAVDYADGLVRVGVQSAVTHPETGEYIRKLMADRGMEYPPMNRKLDSICIVEICKERTLDYLKEEQQQQQ
jgi:ankyrin repeat protein